VQAAGLGTELRRGSATASPGSHCVKAHSAFGLPGRSARPHLVQGEQGSLRDGRSRCVAQSLREKGLVRGGRDEEGFSDVTCNLMGGCACCLSKNVRSAVHLAQQAQMMVHVLHAA
jgi:hypothetical protein